MNKMKPAILFFVAVVFFGVLMVHAQSNRELQHKKAAQRADPVRSQDKLERANSPERPAFTGSPQGYKMVTDVLDVFGGESESGNYRIPLNAGGQPSGPGISQSDSFVVKAGYVHAAFVQHGDADGDGIIDVSDVVYLIRYLFKNGAVPIPMEAGDVNWDGMTNIADVVHLLNYVYKDGPPPCSP